MEISALTELDAVNDIIGTLGEAPIDSLEDVTDVDAINAYRILTEVSRIEQARGWSFNYLEDYVLEPDEEDNYRIPWNDHFLFLRADDYKLVRSGNYVKDIIENTTTFEDSITVDVVLWLPFEQLPEQMRAYIVAKAGFMFQSAYYGDEGMLKVTQMQVEDTWQHLMDLEMDSNEYTMLDNEYIQELLSR